MPDKKFLIAGAVLFGIALLLIGCGGSGDTVGPSTVAAAPDVQPVAPAAAAATPAGTASAKVWAHGEVDVTGPFEGFVCYFWDGPHEQDKASPDVAVSISTNKTERFHFPVIEQDSPEHCRVQIDVGTDCRRSSIIPGMLASGYVTVGECEKECVPGEDIVTTEETEGEWTDGQCPDTFAESCNCGYEHRIITTTTTTKNECSAKSSTATRCEQREKTCRGICHVSNKGLDSGDWNLQVSYKRNGNGHVLHLDTENFCPADFRSTRANCTVPNAYRQLAAQNYCQ